MNRSKRARRHALRRTMALALVLTSAACGAPPATDTDAAGGATDRALVKRDLAAHVAPLGSTVAHGGTTLFNPAVDGFQFINDFRNTFGPLHTAGLCGGMSYAALDYFNARMTIPQQSYRPEEGTPLQSYLYNREETSIESSLGTWTSWSLGGQSQADTFSEQIGVVMSSIDRGVPIPLGLQGTNGTGSHQMLAVGYWTNPAAPQTTATQISVYDPNHPGETDTLVFDTTHQVFTLAEHDLQDQWAGFFADTSYSSQTPPTVPEPVYGNDGLVHELFIVVATGVNALMGGPNAALEIGLTNGTTVSLQGLNLGQDWLAGYTETARVVLPTPLDPGTISSVTLSETSACDVTFPWNVSSINVQAVGSSTWMLATGSGNLSCAFPDQALSIVQIPPKVTNVNPPHALPGATMWFTGVGFRADGSTQVTFGTTSVKASCPSSTECTAIVPAGANAVPLTLSEPVLDFSKTLPRPPAPLQTFTASAGSIWIDAMACSYGEGCGGSIDVQCTPDASDDPMTVTASPSGSVAQTLPLSSAGFAQFIEGEPTTFTPCVETASGTNCNWPVTVNPNTTACAPSGCQSLACECHANGGTWAGPPRNTCVYPCSPATTCEEGMCGTVSDGCTGTLQCAPCPPCVPVNGLCCPQGQAVSAGHCCPVDHYWDVNHCAAPPPPPKCGGKLCQ